MRTALLAIALVLGFAASAGPERELARRAGAATASAGGAAARPDGVLVIAALSPERAIVADPLTGRTRERVFPGGTLCHGPLLAVGDRFVFTGTRGHRFEPRVAPIAAPGRDRSLGAAEIVTPSSTPGLLWLGHRRGGRIELREVDTRGRVHARASTPGSGWGVHAHVGGRFLTEDMNGLVLGDERFPGAWLVAAQGDRFAWCGEPCPRVGLWSGGERRALVPPDGVLPQPGRPAAFSPDGSRLALSVTAGGKPRFAVVELDGGHWSIVPRARPGDYAALAWSPSGAWLYLAAADDRVLASRGGTGRPRALPVRTRGTVMSIATAARLSRPGSAAR